MKEVCYYQQSAGIRNTVRSRHQPVLRPNAGGLTAVEAPAAPGRV